MAVVPVARAEAVDAGHRQPDQLIGFSAPALLARARNVISSSIAGMPNPSGVIVAVLS